MRRGGSSVDPVACSSGRCAQLGEYLAGCSRHLAQVMMMSQRLQGLYVERVLQGCFVLGLRGCFAACVGRGKNNGSIRSKSFSAIMRSISTEPTMLRQPSRTYQCFLDFNALSELKTVRTGQLATAYFTPARLGQGGHTDDTKSLDQPLIMVGVLVVIARTASPARATEAVFRGTGRQQTWLDIRTDVL